MDLQAIVDNIVGYVWSAPLIVLCLGTGIYFSIRTRFLQVRLIKDNGTPSFSRSSPSYPAAFFCRASRPTASPSLSRMFTSP